MADKPVVDLDKPVLRYRQQQELRDEIDSSQRQLADPDARRAFRGNSAAADPRLTRKAITQAEKMLAEQGPDPHPPAETKDFLKKQVAELEARIKEGMPTQMEMRANPPGTVAKHMRWERGKKRDILRWKHAKVRLEPMNDDPDLANVELLRPAGVRWAPTEAYREGWEQAFGPEPGGKK